MTGGWERGLIAGGVPFPPSLSQIWKRLSLQAPPRQGGQALRERPWKEPGMLTPQNSTPAAYSTSQLGLPELVASWIGTREQCARNRGSLGTAGRGVLREPERTSCSCQVCLGAVARGGVRAAGALEEGQRDHLSALGMCRFHGGFMG